MIQSTLETSKKFHCRFVDETLEKDLIEALLNCVEENGMMPPYDSSSDDEDPQYNWNKE